MLQLCRAEIKMPESWYSANVISDGYQSKPISEIFSTEPTFSSTNPIIVLPNSTAHSEMFDTMSTLAPPNSTPTPTPEVSITSTSGTIPQMSTTPIPILTHTNVIPPLDTHLENIQNLPPQHPTVTTPHPMPNIKLVHETSSIQPIQSTLIPQEPYQEVLPLSSTASQSEILNKFKREQFEFVSTQTPVHDISHPSLESLFQSLPQQPSIPEMTIGFDSQPELVIIQDQLNVQENTTPRPILSTEVTPTPSIMSTSSLSTQPSLFTQTTVLPTSPVSTDSTLSLLPSILNQSIQSEYPVQHTQQTLPPQIIQKSSSPSSPGQWQQIRFEVVPQAPHSISNQPTQTGLTGQSTLSTGSTQQPLSNFFMIYQQAPQSFQSFPSRQLMNSNSPPQLSTVLPLPPSTFPSSTTLPHLSTIVTQIPPQTTLPPISTHQPVTSIPPSSVSSANPCSLTTSRPVNNFRPMQAFPLIPMKIRVVAPSGSITNIHIKPKAISTTTATTRRPITTRKRKPKPKKNSYNYCINSCKGPRNPICAAPLSTRGIDPETLKGFPSICHMACHNSYRIDRKYKLESHFH